MTRVGLTGDDGRLTTRISPPDNSTIRATHAGFGEGFQRLGAPRLGDVTVVLGPPGRVSGTVTSFDGSLPPAGPAVVAVPDCVSVAEFRTLEALLSSDAVRVASIAADGRFQIIGLGLQCEYDIYPAAHGYLATNYGHGIVASDQVLNLEIAKLYGTRVLLKGEGRTQLRCDPEIYTGQPPSWRPVRRGSEPVRPLSPALALLSGLGETVARPSTQFDRLLLFTARVPGADLGEFEFWGSMPGYRPFRAAFVIPELCNAEGIPEEVVVLQQETIGWSTLDVKFTGGVAGTLQLSNPRRRVGSLFMVNPVDGRYLDLDPGTLGTESRRITGVPEGTFRVYFQVPGLPFASPSPDSSNSLVVVGPDPVHLEVDLSQMGAAKVRVRYSNGSDWIGDGSLSIECDTRGATYLAELRSDLDHLVLGLTPGSYRFQLVEPNESEPSEVIEIAPGQIGEVSLILK